MTASLSVVSVGASPWTYQWSIVDSEGCAETNTYRLPHAGPIHNIICHMVVEVAVSNHLTKRNSVWQFVRYVPEDLRDAFPSRAFRSLCEQATTGEPARRRST